MYSYGSPLLKRFETEELNSISKEKRKGRFSTFLFFSGVLFILAIPLYKGVAAWQERIIEDRPTVAPVVETITNTGAGAIEGSSVSEPIYPDTVFLQEKSIPVEKIPTRIIIPALAIDLPIVPAKVIDGYWETSEDAASFGLGSASPGEVGNAVIFAHARTGLFLPIRKIKKDQMVYVFVKNNWYAYSVTETKTVKPTDIEVIAPTKDEILTLYTCSGFADTKRLVVVAKRVFEIGS